MSVEKTFEQRQSAREFMKRLALFAALVGLILVLASCSDDASPTVPDDGSDGSGVDTRIEFFLAETGPTGSSSATSILDPATSVTSRPDRPVRSGPHHDARGRALAEVVADASSLR